MAGRDTTARGHTFVAWGKRQLRGAGWDPPAWRGVQLPVGAKGASPLLRLSLALSPPLWWLCRTNQLLVPALSFLLVFVAPQPC